MNYNEQLIEYINAVLKDLRIGNSISNGSRKEGSDIGSNSLVSGINNEASAPYSAAIGSNNIAKGHSSMALGEGNRAFSNYQLVHGKFNDSDSNNIYAHIVGGGTFDFPKNIYTLDWKGNAWFNGNIVLGENYEEVATKKYIDQQLVIKLFPHNVIDDTSIKVCVNDLDPYTIYKLSTDEKYRRVQFYVDTEFGEVPFLYTDSNINKYSMFVSDKSNDEMSFIVDSVLYRINLKTGRVEKLKDNSFSESDGNGEETNLECAKINDNTTDPNSTWSSLKVSQEIQNDFNEARIENDHLILSRNGTVLADLPLPTYSGPSVDITEEDVVRWNKKIDNPGNGNTGQFLGLGENGPAWIDLPTIDIPKDASQIKYENNIENVENIQQALDKLFYKKPEILNLDSSEPFGLREVGNKVRIPITFSWDYTSYKPIELQSLSDINININEKSFIYTVDDISENMDFTLTVSDTEKNSAILTKSYRFGYGEYYGVSAIPEEYNGDFIRSLTKEILESKDNTITVEAGPSQYIYVCIPYIWDTPIFSHGGLDGGFEKAGEVYFINDYGHEELYYIWKSDNKGLGHTTISIR